MELLNGAHALKNTSTTSMTNPVETERQEPDEPQKFGEFGLAKKPPCNEVKNRKSSNRKLATVHSAECQNKKLL
ncbi:MAG: hypothetical protein ACREEK_01355 [Bradyrhizobium sp.]